VDLSFGIAGGDRCAISRSVDAAAEENLLRVFGLV
jgi:hypothetical protein